MSRKTLYLILFIAGVAIPISVFLPWLAAHGMNVRLFAQELFANRISTFFALDLLLTAVCVLHLARLERERLRLWWVPALVTVLIGVSAGLPLLLYLRADLNKDQAGGEAG